MPVIADARLETTKARDYIAGLGKQLREKTDARPEVKADIDWSETHGTVAFAWGRCTLLAERDALTLRVEANDEEGLPALMELITRHIEKLGAGENLTVTWQQAEGPVTHRQEAGHGRDAMREFHRRARSASDAESGT